MSAAEDYMKVYERAKKAEARCEQLEAALKDDIRIINRWKSATAAEQVRALNAEARVQELEAALGHILEHAELDLSERGIAEAERYVAIAREALGRKS